MTRSATWKWSVCGMLLLATMLNYMDRQTLSQSATDIQKELSLDDAQYGRLEMGFGFAFAAGGLFFGMIADRVAIRLLYPFVLIAWSLAGFATAYAHQIGEAIGGDSPGQIAYRGFLACRVALGFFEAGQWPCALVATSRILSREERTLGNSILQSGASVGAILTPIVIQLMDTKLPGSWQLPFQAIGLIGIFWIVPWFLLIRSTDLLAHDEPSRTVADVSLPPVDDGFWRRFAACVVTVVMINLTWQFFRAWLPKYLRESVGYEKETVNYFTTFYYISTDVGCIAAGTLVRYLAARDWDVHRARVATYFLCALTTALSVAVAFLPKGPMLLAVLLFVGAGTLGLFPNYYAFSQDLSRRHQGKLTGVLSAITWSFTAVMQKTVGEHIEATKSYQIAIIGAGLAPLIAGIAIVVLWKRAPVERR